MDTATVLTVRAAIEIIEARLVETIDALGQLAARYRDTSMAGAPICSMRCPSPSASRRRSGFRGCSGIASASGR